MRENHDNEIERLVQERELEIEAVRTNANSEPDAIIFTKNRELVPTTFSKSSSPKSRDVFLQFQRKPVEITDRKVLTFESYRLEMLRKQRDMSDNTNFVSSLSSQSVVPHRLS